MTLETLEIQPLTTNATVTRAHDADAGLDLHCIEDFHIDGLGRIAVGTGIAINLPEGYMARVCPRSGLARNYGIDILGDQRTHAVQRIGRDAHAGGHLTHVAGGRIPQKLIVQGQEILALLLIQGENAQTEQQTEQSAEQAQQTQQTTQAPALEPAPAPAPAPQPAPQQDVYYQNCTAARAAGAAPIYQGQPGYRSQLDRDHDGVACE